MNLCYLERKGKVFSFLKTYEKKVKADRQTKAIDSQLVYHDQCLANKVLGATKAVRRGQALR